MSTNLFALLAEQGIKLKSLRSEHSEKVLCPKCEGGNSGDDDLSVTIDADGHGFVVHCFNCGWTDGFRLKDPRGSNSSPPAPKQFVPRPPPRHTEATIADRPPWLYDWFAARKIGARVVEKFGIYTKKHAIKKGGPEVDCIVFPFVWKAELRNRKYRDRATKNFVQEFEPLPTLFGVDFLGDEPETVIFCEGEPDVMALAECGVVAVSFKDGAPQPPKDPTQPQEPTRNDKRFSALGTHEGLFAKAKRIVLAGDMDEPGAIWRGELARRLGRHRCWTVTWREGCKDAGDVLRVHGPDAVLADLKAAQPWPIEGVHKVTGSLLLALRGSKPPGTMSIGVVAADRKGIRLPVEGRVIVVTGIPGHGKTSLMRNIQVKTAKDDGRKWAVFSPESLPWEQFAAQCASVFAGKPFWPTPGYQAMSPMDIAEAGDWLNERLSLLVHDAFEEIPTADWIFERAAACVLRDGATDLLIDPFNEIEQARPDRMTETEWIGRFLQRCRAFSTRFGCNVWVIAHPAKPMGRKVGEELPAPTGYDLAGSAHWMNKIDLGLTVHSPRPGHMELSIWKARAHRWGIRGTVAAMNYDPVIGVVSSPIDAPPSTWREMDAPPAWTEVER